MPYIHSAKLSITIPLMDQLLMYVLKICLKHLTMLTILFVKLTKRNVPVNLLILLEYWFFNSRSCIRWSSNSSKFYRLTAGVRQGSALSLCLFTLSVNNVIIKDISCGIGCHLEFACVNIILYADDIYYWLLLYCPFNLSCIYAKVS